MSFALARHVPRIAHEGRHWAVRLQRGAVLLDSRRGRIIEVEEEAAGALDLLVFDGTVRAPLTDDEGVRLRRTFRAFHRELLDDSPKQLGFEKGLLLRHDEPAKWRRPASTRSPDGAVLTLGLIRQDDGSAVALAGPADVVASIAEPFSDRGSPLRDLVVTSEDDIWFKFDKYESRRVIEVWSVELGSRAGLTLVRLSLAQALVNLLLVATQRPTEATLLTLGTCAEHIPHFAAVLPRDLTSRKRAVTEYFARR